MNEIRELRTEEMATLQGGIALDCSICPNSSFQEALLAEAGRWIQSLQGRLY